MTSSSAAIAVAAAIAAAAAVSASTSSGSTRVASSAAAAGGGATKEESDSRTASPEKERFVVYPTKEEAAACTMQYWLDPEQLNATAVALPDFKMAGYTWNVSVKRTGTRGLEDDAVGLFLNMKCSDYRTHVTLHVGIQFLHPSDSVVSWWNTARWLFKDGSRAFGSDKSLSGADLPYHIHPRDRICVRVRIVPCDLRCIAYSDEEGPIGCARAFFVEPKKTKTKTKISKGCGGAAGVDEDADADVVEVRRSSGGEHESLHKKRKIVDGMETTSAVAGGGSAAAAAAGSRGSEAVTRGICSICMDRDADTVTLCCNMLRQCKACLPVTLNTCPNCQHDFRRLYHLGSIVKQFLTVKF